VNRAHRSTEYGHVFHWPFPFRWQLVLNRSKLQCVDVFGRDIVGKCFVGKCEAKEGQSSSTYFPFTPT